MIKNKGLTGLLKIYSVIRKVAVFFFLKKQYFLCQSDLNEDINFWFNCVSKREKRKQFSVALICKM